LSMSNPAVLSVSPEFNPHPSNSRIWRVLVIYLEKSSDISSSLLYPQFNDWL
jgi:hypothetical protein